jgi:hypothetical protein
MDPFRGRRKVRRETALDGRDALRLCRDLPAVVEIFADETSRCGADFCSARVFRPPRAGFGAGRGFRYLSSGFIVLTSELVELTLVFRCLWWSLLKCMGTFRTLTACPGSIGQAVVAGSAGLWKSTSSSNRYYFRCEPCVFANIMDGLHSTNMYRPSSTLRPAYQPLVQHARHRLCSRIYGNRSSARHQVVYLSSSNMALRNCPTSRVM